MRLGIALIGIPAGNSAASASIATSATSELSLVALPSAHHEPRSPPLDSSTQKRYRDSRRIHSFAEKFHDSWSPIKNTPPSHCEMTQPQKAPISTNEVSSADSTIKAGVARVDMKFEIVIIPVSDVDRAKEFYGRLGWRLDADFASGDDLRVIQFTPPGSGCSIIFGKNVTAAAPGSAQGLYLIVSDIEAARDELLSRGVEISEVFHDAGGVYAGKDEPYLFGRVRVSGPDPEHRSYRSFASFSDPDGNGWLLQEITTRLPGRIDSADDFVRLGERSGERASACGGRPRRAREAHRRSATRTGPTGTPHTWWRSRPERSCRNEVLFPLRQQSSSGQDRPVFASLRGCSSRGHGGGHHLNEREFRGP